MLGRVRGRQVAVLDGDPGAARDRGQRYLDRARARREAVGAGFIVEAAGDGARAVWESSFAALDPAMEGELARRWEPFLPVVLANLKEIVETRPE